MVIVVAIKTMFAAMVYYIWRERNSRSFDHSSRHASLVFNDIMFAVFSKFNTLCNVDPTMENKWIQRSLGLDVGIFSCTT